MGWLLTYQPSIILQAFKILSRGLINSIIILLIISFVNSIYLWLSCSVHVTDAKHSVIFSGFEFNAGAINLFPVDLLTEVCI